MIKKVLKLGLVSLVMLFVAGCASLGGGNISTNNPDAYGDAQVSAMSNKDLVGLEAMLGGKITTLSPSGNKVRVEVVRYELDKDGYPIIKDGEINDNRVIVDIYGHVRTNNYTAGDYFTAVGTIKSVDQVSIGGEKVRIIMMDAIDYEFWRDPRREFYYDDFGFNSPAIRYRHYNSHWGFGFGPYSPYYY